MPKAKPWLDVNDYMEYREPNLDRSSYTKSNYWAFGSSTFKSPAWPRRRFDKEKCPSCGGIGRVWIQKAGAKNERRRRKTNIRCPENCEWARDY